MTSINSLPRVSATRSMLISFPLVRYSTSAAENTADLMELLHISFQRQNSFGGIRPANAAMMSLQLSKTGVTAAVNVGTIRGSDYRASHLLVQTGFMRG